MIEHLPNVHKALGSIPNAERQNRKMKFLKFNRRLLSAIKVIALDPRLLQQGEETILNPTKAERRAGEADKCSGE